MPDVIIRGGMVAGSAGVHVADVRIAGERIVEVGPDLPGTEDVIDARGLVVFPGVVDAHVHFNEPGRTEWEGGHTGSRALAAGGGTTFVDMPLNSTPCVVTARDVEIKKAALEASSVADFGLWGGLVPGHIDDMPGMVERGVVGFKAFMCDSGLPEFPRADDETLRAGMVMARQLGVPVAVHAEDEEIVRKLAAQGAASTARAFLDSRPLAAELTAIERVVALASETGASLHIVHVSSGQGVALAADARLRGVDVSIETCPHYLAFTDADLERLDVAGKCAPPFRSAAQQRALWESVLDGRVDIIGSDHSPAPPAMKTTGDFQASWGGIAGVQSTLAVLLEDGAHARKVPLERLAALLAATPARRFGLARKGAVAPGFDADLSLVEFDRSWTLTREQLQQRHPISPYVGKTFRGVVTRTIRRGETIFVDGQVVATGGGRMIRPEPGRGVSWRM